jgi:hypothetical protein
MFLENIRQKVENEYGPREKRGHKALYGDPSIGIEKDQWSRKWRGETEFTLEEISRCSAGMAVHFMGGR